MHGIFQRSLLVCGGLIVSIFICVAQDTQSTQPTGAIALVAGEPIFDSQLPSSVQGELHRIHQQEYEVRSAALEEIINNKLLEIEAEKKSLSVRKLLETEIEKKVAEPSVGELQAYLKTQNIAQPFEEARPRIRALLRQLRFEVARENYLRALREQAGVTVLVQPPKMKISYDAARLKGSRDAPVMIVEFSDFTCPFCAHVNSTLEELLAKYKGRVSLSYRDFPIDNDRPGAHLAAEASRCAEEQGKFWEYHDLLFKNPGRLDREDLVETAKKLQLHTTEFESCLSSGEYKPLVEQDLQDGIAAGVSVTPVFFINGIFLAGAKPSHEFKKIIDQELQSENLETQPSQ